MNDVAPAEASELRHLYLIDGSGFIFRAFHALPPLTRPDGTPVNAVLGFTNMLWKILRETDADHAAVVFDTARLTFRNEIYELYKANRGETPEELIPQFPLVREAAAAFNLASIELEGFEADDLIAAYASAARAQGARVTIVSADKDLMQLVETDSVIMYDYFKNREIGPDQVRERFGVGPERVIDVQALAGDSTDNVPGVPGIGVKTAAQLINDYGDLDQLLARAAEIKQPKRRQNLIEHAEMARVSRDLVTLRRDAPLPMPLEALERRQPEPGSLRAFFQENGFRSIAARLDPDDGETSLAEEEAEPEETAPLPAPYPLVTDADTLADWAEKARDSGVLALESFALEGSPEGAGLVGLALATAPGNACYVPLGHAGPDLIGAEQAVPQLRPDGALGILAPVLGDPGVLKAGLDIKRTLRLLTRENGTLGPIDDPMLASWVLDGSLHNHALEDLTRIHLDRAAPALADVLGSGRSKVSVDAVSPAGTAGHCGGSRRPRPSPPSGYSASAGRRPAHHGLRADRAPADRGAGQDGSSRHPGRPGRTRRTVHGLRRPYRDAGEPDPRSRRPSLHHRLAQAAGRGAIRGDGAQGRAQGQVGCLQHGRRHPGGACSPEATTCRHGCSNGASSPSSRAPTRTR